MGARRNFSRGGKPLGGGPKSVKGGGAYFFIQTLKYAYTEGGGVVLIPAEFFLGALKIKVDLQNL